MRPPSRFRGQRLVLVMMAAACGRGAPSPADSVGAVSTGAVSSTAGLPDRIARVIHADTASFASKETNLMSTPLIDTTRLRIHEADTLQWIAPEDSCKLVIRATGPTGRSWGLVGETMYLAEGSTMGPGMSTTMVPSPDWKHVAYSSSSEVPADSSKWKSEDVTYTEASQAAVARPDGSRWVTFALVEPPAEGCIGEDCSPPFVDPRYGGWRIGWSADSKYLLLATRDDSVHWTAIDPVKRTLASGVSGLEPVVQPWSTKPVSSVWSAGTSTGVTGGGAYRFTSRLDTLVVTGPDRSDKTVERVIGPGVPVVATRNGEHVLAIRRVKGQLEAVIYSFRMSHAMMRTSCDH